MKRITIALLAFLSLAAFSGSAFADFGGPRGALGFGPGMGLGGPELMLGHLADHLDLSDEQRDSIRNILEASKPEVEALREEWQANREALEALDANDPAYSTALDNLALSNGRLATESTLLFTRVRSEIRALLTEEQLAKLERGKDRLRKRFDDRREHRPPRR